MSEHRVARFARRVRDRFALAWDESRVWAPAIADNPYVQDAGETLFIPARLSSHPSGFQPTTRYPTVESLEQRLDVRASSIRLVAGAWVPNDDAAVARFISHASGWGRVLEPGERLYWVQPLSNLFVLSVAEVEQLLGLSGGIDFVEETNTLQGQKCVVAAATVRRRASGVALLWPDELLRDPARLQRALARLAPMPDGVRAGIHVIDVPAVAAEAWRTGARALLETLGRDPDTAFGVRAAGAQTDSAALVALMADVPGVRRRLKVQWHDRSGEPVAPAPRALVAGVTCDCSLELDAPAPWAPYVRDGGYVPIDFDARVPASAPREGALVEIPRVDGRRLPGLDARGWARLTTSPERRVDAALSQLVDEPIDRAARQLREALDLRRRHAYLQGLEANRRDVERWHEFHVYNRPAPPRQILRLIVYDASDLFDHQSALRALENVRPRIPMMTGMRFISAAEGMAYDAVRTAATIREQQIAAHEYLAEGGRQALTGDSEKLIEKLPPTLGAALELGFGYGLTARRVARRANRYVGVELRTEQAKALQAAGGLGLVADVLALPFASRRFDTVIADNVLEHAASPLDTLREIRRVLAPAGRLYALIPVDATTNEFQIRTHLWKADELSVRRAAALSGFRVVELEMLSYAALDVYGCFPASGGRTCLAVFEPAAVAQDRIAV